jgi:uncharacterized protein (DUF58 family)
MIPKEILQNVRRIEIRTRSIVNSILGGEYHSVFKGRGMEFSEVRKYSAGDDIRTIDWNVTARMGEPFIKKHVEERELTVMLLVDASASGNFGSVAKLKSEIAVELCALLAFSAIKNNDRVGLIIFTSEVEKFIPPKKGKNHVLRVIRELLYFEPSKKGTDIAAAMSFLNRVQKKKAVVFAISDFIASKFEAPLRVAARRHDLVALHITDPREKEIPNVGLMEIEDPETGEMMLVDSGSSFFRKQYANSVKTRSTELANFFKVNGVDRIDISTQGDYVDPIIRFFKKRERIAA